MSATETVVDVNRFHLSLNVNDLSKAVQFLTSLLGCAPTKRRADYAKFEPTDLPVVLSLEPRAMPQPPLRNTAGEGPLNHVGIRMTDAAQLVDVQRRLEAAGYSTQREDGVECCYARQTKFWVHDSDRTMWEVYVLEEDLEHRGGQHDELHSHRHSHAAGDAAVITQRQTWTHRLSEDFPDSIPGSGQLDEILLQGTWNAKRHDGQWSTQLKRVQAALRPGGKVILHILTSNEPVTELKPLSGPAAVVQVVPLLSDVISVVKDAGLVNVQFVKYGSAPCFQQDGVEMRETRLEAFKPSVDALGIGQREELVEVVYKGPFSSIADDSGITFHCGKPTQIPEIVWDRIAASPMSEAFTRFNPRSNAPVSCGTTYPKLHQIG